MDDFTEKILERARARQKKLCESDDIETVKPLEESNAVDNLPLSAGKKVSSAQELRSHQQRATEKSPLKQTISDGNLTKLEKQVTRISTDMNVSKNVRIEVEIQGSDTNLEEKENLELSTSANLKGSPPLREDSRKRLQRLGKLYAGGDDANISSPIHRTEAEFAMKNTPERAMRQRTDNKDAESSKDKNRKGLGGLATLAQTINQWEDDISQVKVQSNKPVTVKKSWKAAAPQPPTLTTNKSTPTKSSKPPAPKPPANVITKSNITLADEGSQEKTTKFKLDPTVIKTLESQGFTRTNSDNRLIYNYESSVKDKKMKTNVSAKECSKINCITEEIQDNDAAEKQSPSKSVTAFSQKMSSNKDGVFSPPKNSKIANRAAMFEKNNSHSKRNSLAKDPALLSVSERKALFEKNKGTPPIPKAPISLAAPIITEKGDKSQYTSKPTTVSSKNSERTNVLNKVKINTSSSPIKGKQEVDSAYKIPPDQPGGIASKVAALFKHGSTISQQQIESSIREQRQKEMDVLLNRFQRNKEATVEQDNIVEDNDYLESEFSSDDNDTETTPMVVNHIKKNTVIVPSAPPLHETSGKKRKSTGKKTIKDDSPKVTAILDDVKRIKVSSKPGRLYPCLSDIEATTEPETDRNTPSTNSNNSSLEEYNCSDLDDVADAETSFGREILETVCKKHQPHKRSYSDESFGSNPSDILDGEDDYLDEVAEFTNSSGPTPRKQGRSISPVNDSTQSSDSFQYKTCTPKSNTKKEPAQDFRTPKRCSPRKSEEFLPAVMDGNNILTLTHTVSFYRKQQTQNSSTPIKQVIRYPIVEDESSHTALKNEADPTTTSKIISQKRIKELEKEIEIQCQTIQQTSRGLNWCNDNPEFMRSTEQVELERVLLLATHRRSAIQHEIDRLHVMGSENLTSSEDSGNLTISNIVLPLKHEYVRALNATGGKGHHVVCLIECAEQVHATALVSTIATNDRNPDLDLNIPGTITLLDVPNNFTVKIEVYCLIAQEEAVPHEVKYHLNKKRTTPKKVKNESRLMRPPVESPGGPYIIRSSAFASMGYVIFDLQAINKKNWTLNNTPSKSPLKGNLEMRLKYNFQMNIEHRGFLNVLEYISDSNMWHRRWCVLSGHTLRYWKYPEDEKVKKPMESVDLRNCCTKQIGPAPRQVSARLFTLMIEIMRPSKPEDKSTALMMPDGAVTVIRHVIATDTKEERVEWSSILNKALTAVKINETTK